MLDFDPDTRITFDKLIDQIEINWKKSPFIDEPNHVV